MGASIKAFCPCGYQARAAVASSGADHGRVFMFPHACSTCGELVNVDLLAVSFVCPKCSGTRLTPFGVAVPNKKLASRWNWFPKSLIPKRRNESEAETPTIAETSVSSTNCYRLKTTFHLPAEGNQCPKCNQSNLKFEYPDIRVD